MEKKSKRTQVSDIEDGFAMKRAKDKSRNKKANKVKGECVIPPPPAKHILTSYSLSSPRRKKEIAQYVLTQASDEHVLHVERVKSEHILGRDHHVWDVHTDKDRYWVITSPTNLYSQHYFPSLDYTLSFHVGVMLRVAAAQGGAPTPSHQTRFAPYWRRWDQATESYDNAEEVEDYQAVGMKCRETLIQFAKSLAKPEMVPEGEEAPKRSDVIHWLELVANFVAKGQRNDDIRSYLKVVSKNSWQLANWLTHTGAAVREDASFVLDATHHVLSAFGSAVMRHEGNAPETCPDCGSRSIETEFDFDLMPNPYIPYCTHCGWQGQRMTEESEA